MQHSTKRNQAERATAMLLGAGDSYKRYGNRAGTHGAARRSLSNIPVIGAMCNLEGGPEWTLGTASNFLTTVLQFAPLQDFRVDVCQVN